MIKKDRASNQKGFMSVILVVVVVLAIATGVIAVKFNPHPLTRIKDKVQLILARGHETKADIRFRFLEWEIKDIIFARDANDFDEVADEAEDFREEVQEVIHDITEITEIGNNADTLKARLNAAVESELKELRVALEKTTGAEKEAINKEIASAESLILK